MSVASRRTRAAIEANLTPMIDVSFLLIFFFVLVSQIVDVESVEMDLPRPGDPASELPGEEHRAVINVLPGPGGRASGYRLGGRVYRADAEGVGELAGALAALYGEDPALSVNLRADRAAEYRAVEPLFGAVAAAARSSGRGGRVNLVVVREP